MGFIVGVSSLALGFATGGLGLRCHNLGFEAFKVGACGVVGA